MEGIEKIKEKILEEAEQKSRQILDKARAEADEMLKNAASDVEGIKQQALLKAKRQAEEEKRKILSMAELEARKLLLEAKQQMIDEAFEKACRELADLPADVYQKWIYDMLLKSDVKGEAEIVFNEKDKSNIPLELIEKANDELKKQGKAANFKVSGETRPMMGGFILKAGDVEINNTFDSMIKSQREELETEIAKILFGE